MRVHILTLCSTLVLAPLLALTACSDADDTKDTGPVAGSGSGGQAESGSGGHNAGSGGAGLAGTGGRGATGMLDGGPSDAQAMTDAQVGDAGAVDGSDGACVDGCSNHGTCNATGACACDRGYVGASCATCAIGWSPVAGGTSCERDGSAPAAITIEQWGVVGYSEVRALAVGTSDEAIYAGQTTGTLPGEDAQGMTDLVVGGRFVAAQSADNWAHQWGTAKLDKADGVAVDEDGNIFAAGMTGGDLDGNSAGYDDAVLSKWNADHQLEWTTQWGSAGSETVTDMARGADGNLYVTGWTSGGVDGSNAGLTDVFVSKLSPSGAVTWSVQVGTAADDRAFQVAVDADGNAYATGPTAAKLGSDAARGGNDIFVLKVDAGGDVKWIRQFGTGIDDTGLGIGCLSDGDVVVGGQAGGLLPESQGTGDAFVARLSAASGDPIWVRQPGPNSGDGSDRIAVGADDTVYIAGSTDGDYVPNGNHGARDVFVQAVDPDGDLLWAQQFGTNTTDQVLAIAVTPNGILYVGGTTAGQFSGETKTGDFDNFLITIEP